MELKITQKGRRSINTTDTELGETLKKNYGILACNSVMAMILTQLKIHDVFDLVNRSNTANITIKVISR